MTSRLKFWRNRQGNRSLRPRREHVTQGLVDLLPHFFDRTLSRATQPQLKLLIFVLLFMSVPLIITPLKIWQQGVVAVLLAIMGWLVVEVEKTQTSKDTSEYLHLFLVWLSSVTTLRYLYYRTSYTLNFDTWINGIACVLLYAAELYAILTLFLAYFQTLKIKDREPVDLSLFPEDQWFKVDIYLPTYNEDVEIVRNTALGALALDYPADKKRVYILDDGRAEKYKARREQLRQMCDELGCILLTRDNNDHAKAGNINTAFRRTDGDLVLILDCDHIPSRQLLQHTVGFFFDEKVAFVQTPHWFYNPDPFERNLLTRGKVPVGNELFYKVLQKGNDFWNAAFFCGSAAVIRKEYALQVGGIATETVTEDCHTAFRLHSLGYKSIYYDKIMVAGLAPEKFVSYVGQQVRWARGMAQILRLENPMFNRKLNLTIPQRLCYLSATSHFFYGFPRLMYAIAPTLYLLFAINPIQGLGVETLVYALPHILLALNTNYITYKEVRYSFWNEIYEFAMAYQSGIVTFMALINPKLGSFNVTDKGLVVTKRSFDWQSSRVLIGVAALIVTSLIAVPFWLILRPEDKQAVLVNALWCGFNLVLIAAALLVAFEQPQLRRAHRLNRELTAIIYSNERTWTGKTTDVSETGAQIVLDSWPNIPDEVEVELVGDFGARAFLSAQIVRGLPLNESQSVLAVNFINASRPQLDALSLVLYSDVKEWYSQKREEVDDPLGSLRFLATGLMRAFRETKPSMGVKVRQRVQALTQLYWEGDYYLGQVIEMGVSSIRLEMDGSLLPHLDQLQRTKPVVGLLISQGANDATPTRLLAGVQAVEVVSEPTSEALNNRILLELSFPQPFQQRQQAKIQQLLKRLA
jgi:cellulose synthase (UDP-forming)